MDHVLAEISGKACAKYCLSLVEYIYVNHFLAMEHAKLIKFWDVERSCSILIPLLFSRSVNFSPLIITSFIRMRNRFSFFLLLALSLQSFEETYFL